MQLPSLRASNELTEEVSSTFLVSFASSRRKVVLEKFRAVLRIAEFLIDARSKIILQIGCDTD